MKEPHLTVNLSRDNLSVVTFLGCNDCGKTVKALCKKHGELAKVKDRFIPSRAKLTTPHQLVVKTIELRAAGNHGNN